MKISFLLRFKFSSTSNLAEKEILIKSLLQNSKIKHSNYWKNSRPIRTPSPHYAPSAVYVAYMPPIFGFSKVARPLIANSEGAAVVRI